MIDLHIHSVYSDGTNTTEELIKIINDKNIKTVSLTDHDTLYGLNKIATAAPLHGIHVIPGVEISSVSDGLMIHILGYGIDINNSQLNSLLDINSAYYTKCFCDQFSWLNKNHIIEYDYERVFKHMQFKQALYPSDIIKAMIADGEPYTLNDWPEFFETKVKQYSGTFIDNFPCHPRDAVDVIRAAGGIPVFAHPARIGSCDIPQMKALVPFGLGGVEVYYPFHDDALIKKYEDFAAESGLIKTGGTDWHGKEFTTWGSEIGDFGPAATDLLF